MQQHLHPEVAEQQAQRRADRPELCNRALGCVHPTAGAPRPRWCVRPLGHVGMHMPEARYSQYRELARDRQRQKRERDL